MSGMRIALAVLAICATLTPVHPARSGERAPLPGPFLGRVERVIDGDTLDVRVRIWLDQEILVRVRLADIDAPELQSRCPAMRRLARLSRNVLAGMVAGSPVRLTNVRRGKFFGRVIAEVFDMEGHQLSRAMLRRGLAWPYRERRRYRGRDCHEIGAFASHWGLADVRP